MVLDDDVVPDETRGRWTGGPAWRMEGEEEWRCRCVYAGSTQHCLCSQNIFGSQQTPNLTKSFTRRKIPIDTTRVGRLDLMTGVSM
jgi:hypothetical protein